MLLTSVSGVGPKTALAISDHGAQAIVAAVQTADTSFFTSIPRVGKKNAQKITLELKDKLGTFEIEGVSGGSGDIDVVEALQALGYSQPQARDVLAKMDPKITDTSERVKEALKKLNN
jgi:Holliday junction DNA helicase RuvA